MNESKKVSIEAAAISDRGLSEKRPLNEDSFLSDPVRRIFAVADGVGGAQAGEVASQTAVEVLDEAFRHQVDGADIEDLMEIAIQRANSSIFQMAHDSPKLSAMATTVVALHLDGHVATIGHVGDSRLYRLSPDSSLHRETADHSVVEEEVRAGRMTPEQAAHHPSRNVISRALGAESGVEVDMKTIEVADGTAFLLCSDGITRHIPDSEIRDLLVSTPDLESICAEMKRRCYERGAEDNLTAVVVRVGSYVPDPMFDDERTVLSSRPAELATTSPGLSETAPMDSPAMQVAAAPIIQPAPAAAVPLPVPPPASTLPPPPVGENNAHETNPVLSLNSGSQAVKRKGGAGRAFLLVLLFAAVAAGAFYGGTYYQRQQAQSAAQQSATPQPTPSPVDAIREFENKRAEADKDPANTVKTMREEMAAKGMPNPLDSTDPEFLYLYGRALVLMGDNLSAMTAFERAIGNLKENASPLHDKLRVDSRLAALAVALRLRAFRPNIEAEQKAIRAFDELINKGANQLDVSQ
jgi:serine/threonine protein phosphatase PrpC